MHLHRSHLDREVFDLLHQGLQQPNQIVLLRVAELREAGQALHHPYFRLRLQRELSSH